jgi:hypothetical protein
MYGIISSRQPTVSGPPARGLGGGLTTPPIKLNICYETLSTASEQDDLSTRKWIKVPRATKKNKAQVTSQVGCVQYLDYLSKNL